LPHPPPTPEIEDEDENEDEDDWGATNMALLTELFSSGSLRSERAEIEDEDENENEYDWGRLQTWRCGGKRRITCRFSQLFLPCIVKDTCD